MKLKQLSQFPCPSEKGGTAEPQPGPIGRVDALFQYVNAAKNARLFPSQVN